MTGMAIVVIPIFISETSPRRLRGMMTSTIQIMITLGSLIASLGTYGMQHPPERGSSSSPDNDHQGRIWRIPIGLQLVTPAIIRVLLPLLPESPS
jgi:SP family sugar:H+ symporter-like MFS transporter